MAAQVDEVVPFLGGDQRPDVREYAADVVWQLVGALGDEVGHEACCEAVARCVPGLARLVRDPQCPGARTPAAAALVNISACHGAGLRAAVRESAAGEAAFGVLTGASLDRDPDPHEALCLKLLVNLTVDKDGVQALLGCPAPARRGAGGGGEGEGEGEILGDENADYGEADQSRLEALLNLACLLADEAPRAVGEAAWAEVPSCDRLPVEETPEGVEREVPTCCAPAPGATAAAPGAAGGEAGERPMRFEDAGSVLANCSAHSRAFRDGLLDDVAGPDGGEGLLRRLTPLVFLTRHPAVSQGVARTLLNCCMEADDASKCANAATLVDESTGWMRLAAHRIALRGVPLRRSVVADCLMDALELMAQFPDGRKALRRSKLYPALRDAYTEDHEGASYTPRCREAMEKVAHFIAMVDDGDGGKG